MRNIGTLPDEKRARSFSDLLLSRKIRNEIEPEAGTAWLVWVLDEERVPEAQGLLATFLANPDSTEFRDAKREAAKVRASGVGLDKQSIEWLLIWLVICFTGLVGRVANTAHVTGLVVGMIWGRVSAYLATR